MIKINTAPLVSNKNDIDVWRLVRIVTFTFVGFVGILTIIIILILNNMGWIVPYGLGGLSVLLLTLGILYSKEPNRPQNDPVADFVKVNALTDIPAENMFEVVPPSLANIKGSTRAENTFVMNVEGVPVYIFDYIDSSKKGIPDTFGVATIQLIRANPHLYLDGHANYVPSVYRRSQTMVLEGDFYKYFKLYSEDGKGIETLTLLTPDVMAAFIDTAAQYDIEVYANKISIIVDGSLFTVNTMSKLLMCLETLLHELKADESEMNIPIENIFTPDGLKRR